VVPKRKEEKNKSKGEEEPKHLNLSLILQGEAMNEIMDNLIRCPKECQPLHIPKLN